MVFLGRDFAEHKEYSEQTAVDIDAEVRRIVTANYERAKQVITGNMDKLNVLAEALLEYETLDGSEIDVLLRAANWTGPARLRFPRRARAVASRSKPGLGNTLGCSRDRCLTPKRHRTEGWDTLVSDGRADCRSSQCDPRFVFGWGTVFFVEDAVAAGLAMVAQGADWVDVGGRIHAAGGRTGFPRLRRSRAWLQ